MTTEKKYPIPTLEQEDLEEALGVVWQKGEEGVRDKQTILPILEEGISKEIYPKLVAQRYLREEGGQILLAGQGESIGKSITRRHRLAERLLTDVLALNTNAIDPNACKLEHILSEEVADSICTLLGHPTECPHGSRIPAGGCCEKTPETIAPIITSLDKLEAGARGKIAYLALQHHPDLHRLLAFGLVPGTLFSLHQIFPSFVIEVGETTLALEKEIAEKIFIRPAD